MRFRARLRVRPAALALVVKVDYGERRAESDETNNIGSAALP